MLMFHLPGISQVFSFKNMFRAQGNSSSSSSTDDGEINAAVSCPKHDASDQVSRE